MVRREGRATQLGENINPTIQHTSTRCQQFVEYKSISITVDCAFNFHSASDRVRFVDSATLRVGALSQSRLYGGRYHRRHTRYLDPAYRARHSSYCGISGNESNATGQRSTKRILRVPYRTRRWRWRDSDTRAMCSNLSSHESNRFLYGLSLIYEREREIDIFVII